MRRKEYIRPKVSIEAVGLESGICNGSATIDPKPGDGDVSQSWEEGGDLDFDLDFKQGKNYH